MNERPSESYWVPMEGYSSIENGPRDYPDYTRLMLAFDEGDMGVGKYMPVWSEGGYIYLDTSPMIDKIDYPVEVRGQQFYARRTGDRIHIYMLGTETVTPVEDCGT